MLISDEYRKLNAELHSDQPNYGAGGNGAAEDAKFLCSLIEQGPFSTVLDYGCGKGVLLDHIRKSMPNSKIFGYDPAIPDFSDDPPVCQFTYSTDVLEHVEPTCLNDVLAHIASKTSHGGYLVVSTIPAQKTLKDGRNAHLIVEDCSWWADRIGQHFNIVTEDRHDIATCFSVLAKGLGT